MKLPILEQKNINDFPKFIDFWAQMYKFEDDVPYDECINKKTFTKDDIQKLYEWKNGMILSEKKQKSLNEKIISKLSVINELKQNFDKEKFRKEFKNVSLVWKIFLLHIIEPQKFPIYDQHIHRAYQFICEKDWQGISPQMKDKDKEDFYFDVYQPFIETQVKTYGLKIREIDRGIFIFGGDLKQKKLSFKL